MENYYSILSQSISGDSAEFSVLLREDCPVYAGHFPSNPIAPGACSIEMVRQCASILIQREVRFAEIRQCKFLRLMQPGSTAMITMKLENDRLRTMIMTDGEPAAQINVVIA